MKTSKKAIATLLAVVLMLSLVLTMTGCASIKVKDVEKDPTKQVLTSITKTKEILKDSGNKSPLTYMVKTFEKGAFTVRYAGEDKPTINNTMYFDAKNNKFADELVIGEGDDKTEIGAYLNASDFVLSLPEEYGGKNVGVKLEALAEELKDADAIWELSGMTYEDFHSQLGVVLDALNNAENKGTLAELLKLKEMTDKLKELLDDCDIDVVEDKVITGTKKVKAIIITYNLSTEELTKLSEILIDWAGESYATLMAELGDSVTDMGFLPSDIKSEMSGIKDQLKTAFADAKLRAAITVAINPKTEVVMRADCKLTATVDKKEEHVTVSLDLGEDPRTSAEYQLNFITSSGIESAASKVTIGYQRKDSEGLYHRRIYCTILGDEFDQNVELVLKWNTKSNIYTLAYDSVDTSVIVSGDCKADGKKLSFSVDKVEVNDEITEVGLEFEFEPGKKTPDAPSYTSIFDLSKEELENLLAIVGGNKSFDDDSWGDLPEGDKPIIDFPVTN